MITARNIYGFKTAICPAAAQLFTARELTAYTFFTSPQFQKNRFRVEADLEVGGSKGHLYEGEGFGSVPGTTHETLRTAKLKLDVVTQVNADIQEEAVAAVRNIMATFLTAVNPLLEFHRVEWCSDAGVTNEGEDASEGCYHTELSYDIEFSIKLDKLAEFVAQT